MVRKPTEGSLPVSFVFISSGRYTRFRSWLIRDGLTFSLVPNSVLVIFPSLISAIHCRDLSKAWVAKKGGRNSTTGAVGDAV